MIDATTRAQGCVLLKIPTSQAGKREGLGKRVSNGTNRQQGWEGLERITLPFSDGCHAGVAQKEAVAA